MKKYYFPAVVAATLFAVAATALWSPGTQAQAGGDPVLSSIELLGKYVFFQNISNPNRQSCSTCHDPTAGWVGKIAGVNKHQVAMPGADPRTAGTLKPPSNAYATSIPFQPTNSPFAISGFFGGAFWNGRAEGDDPLFPAGATRHIGDEVFQDAFGVVDLAMKAEYEKYLGPIADQALNPFLNPVEQNTSELAVCEAVASAKYAPLYEAAWKEPIDCTPGEGLDKSYRRIAVSIAAWQRSTEVNSFSSKRDFALASDSDGEFPLDGFTDQENLGHDLFYSTFLNPLIVNGVPKITNCAICHSENPFPIPDTGTEPEQRYTDDSYHNIGTPPNPEIPGAVIDPGLAGHTGNPAHTSLHKTPTLRNVDKRPGKGWTKAYTHNGYFKSLESLVHFYNTAAIKAECAPGTTEKEALQQDCWPAPESTNGSAVGFIIGNMGLTPEEEAALVAYMKTFNDTYTPKKPRPYK